jgi:hypothetical protein
MDKFFIERKSTKGPLFAVAIASKSNKFSFSSSISWIFGILQFLTSHPCGHDRLILPLREGYVFSLML